MAAYRLTFLYFMILTCLLPAFGQEKLEVLTGRTLGPENHPIPGVNIRVKNTQLGTYSDQNGKFSLTVNSGKDIVLIFSVINHQTTELTVISGTKQELTIVMNPASVNLSEVEVKQQRKINPGIVNINPLEARNLSNAGGGAVEQLVKSMPGVSSHNELSPQYSVRGGNYDENLLYVNGIEIFRPFLVKTGEQEGLSFLNPDLVSAIRFSSGGFESSFGDKMSSVLDIDYKKPDRFEGTAEVGALGASAHLEGKSFRNRFTYLTGFRYRNNRYLLGTLDQKGHYDPSAIDFQALLGYEFSPRFSLNILANISSNTYNFTPETRETSFGTMTRSYLLRIYFEGHEKDQFNNRFCAVTGNYNATKKLNLQFTASTFYSDEKERYDILGQYYLNEVIAGSDPGAFSDSTMLLGVGSSLVHAGNLLQANILNFEHRGKYITDNHRIQWGIKYQSERILDEVSEWEMRDSAGYSVPLRKDGLELFRSKHASNSICSNRYSAFLQDNFSSRLENSTFSASFGGRIQYWDFTGQVIFSPRVSATWVPDNNKPMQLHASWGIYQQMPFFKELKDRNAEIVSTVKAQKSTCYSFGMDYPFTWGDRPFKFSAELWYKALRRLIPYKVTNLDLQYFPYQQAKGYATGLEMRIFGEPLPGFTSWASLTLMKTEEDILGDSYEKFGGDGLASETVYPGYIPRPTDQRFNFSLFFQDYLPRNPSVKMNLTLLYGSSLPFGPPQGERYLDVFRMPPYSRVDLGISKMLIGSSTRKGYNLLAANIREAWISFEIFNLFDLNNVVSYYWVSDFQNQMHAVPNYLTARRVNFKFAVNF
jgi:hypothetical protein